MLMLPMLIPVTMMKERSEQVVCADDMALHGFRSAIESPPGDSSCGKANTTRKQQLESLVMFEKRDLIRR